MVAGSRRHTARLYQAQPQKNKCFHITFVKQNAAGSDRSPFLRIQMPVSTTTARPNDSQNSRPDDDRTECCVTRSRDPPPRYCAASLVVKGSTTTPTSSGWTPRGGGIHLCSLQTQDGLDERDTWAWQAGRCPHSFYSGHMRFQFAVVWVCA